MESSAVIDLNASLYLHLFCWFTVAFRYSSSKQKFTELNVLYQLNVRVWAHVWYTFYTLYCLCSAKQSPH